MAQSLRNVPVLLLSFILLTTLPPQAMAQNDSGNPADGDAGGLTVTEGEEDQRSVRPAPLYDTRLARLSEILGAIHYLRSVCDKAEPQQSENPEQPADIDWRAAVAGLLDEETANEPERRAKLTAAFNRGYRAFAAVYAQCTPAAIEAEARYREEGTTLVREIIARFGN